jgi:DNA cross-link repair 1A protein
MTGIFWGIDTDVIAVARVLGSTIYCDPRKKGILLCETDPELHSMISSDPIAVSFFPTLPRWS